MEVTKILIFCRQRKMEWSGKKGLFRAQGQNKDGSNCAYLPILMLKGLAPQQLAVQELCSRTQLTLLQLAIPVNRSPQDQCTLCRYNGKLILTVIINQVTHTFKHAILCSHLQTEMRRLWL
jgi:hypothetical protein